MKRLTELDIVVHTPRRKSSARKPTTPERTPQSAVSFTPAELERGIRFRLERQIRELNDAIEDRETPKDVREEMQRLADKSQRSIYMLYTIKV